MFYYGGEEGEYKNRVKIEKIEMKNQKKEKRKESVCVESKLGRELCVELVAHVCVYVCVYSVCLILISIALASFLSKSL